MFLVCASVRTHSLLGVSFTVQAPDSLRVGEPVARPRCACLFDMNTTAEVYVAAKNVLLLLSHLLECSPPPLSPSRMFSSSSLTF